MPDRDPGTDPRHGIGGRLLGFWLRFCLLTARTRVSMPAAAEPHLFGRNGERAIVGFWHECLPMIPLLWWHARRRNPALSLSVLISRHRDGRMIAGIVERWGMRTVAGSTAKPGRDRDKGGTAALRTLLERLAAGELVAITPDGPRGPRRELQPGILRLAALSGVPVVAVAASCRPGWRLRSWDRMVLPLPFGRISLHCSAPVPVPRRDRGEAAAAVEAAMRTVMGRVGGAPDHRPALRSRLAFRGWAAAAAAAEPAVRLLLLRRSRRGKELPHRLSERRGIESGPRPAGRLVWLHAASVGESLSLLPVVAALLHRDAELSVLLTTATVSAQHLLADRLRHELAAGRVRCRFVPMDVPRWVDRFVSHWRPDLAVFVESELWPNLLVACRRRGVPLALLNARLSARSAARWRRAGPLGRDLLGMFRLVAARSDEDAERWRGLGVDGVVREGDLKRAADPLPFDAAELDRLRALLGDRPLWLAASTHPGEEAGIAATHRALVARHPDLLTLLAPRHPERGAAVSALLGAAPRRALSRYPAPSDGFWVLDTLGELGLFFRLSPIVLLGNSLAEAAGRAGGHNPFEPARLGCALATGPRVDNFRDDVAALQREGAIAVLGDDVERAAWLGRMLGVPAECRAAGEAARAAATPDPGLAGRLADRLLALADGVSC